MRIIPASLLLVLSALPAGASAELPLSPSLTAQTREGLNRLLARAGYPEVSWSSIEISLYRTLGLEGRPSRIAYRHNYAHLPLAWARSVRSGRCMAVTLVAWYANRAHRPVELRGLYCRQTGYRWRAVSQQLRTFRAGEPAPRMPPPGPGLAEVGG
jgi:hypothetical protein